MCLTEKSSLASVSSSSGEGAGVEPVVQLQTAPFTGDKDNMHYSAQLHSQATLSGQWQPHGGLLACIML